MQCQRDGDRDAGKGNNVVLYAARLLQILYTEYFGSTVSHVTYISISVAQVEKAGAKKSLMQQSVCPAIGRL